MRRFLTLFVILFAVALHPVYAQGGMGGGMGMGGMGGGMRGGMSGGPGQGQGMQERVQLTPEDIVTSLGLFVISPEPIIKKCKLKDEATIDKLGAALAEYSREFDNISFEYAPQLDSITNVEDNKPTTVNVQDRSSMTSMQQEMRNRMNMVRKIKERATAMHKKLQEDVKEIFDEKQLKRWESYYAELCSENYFSTQERGGRGEGSGQRPGGGMNGGGMNGGGMDGGMGDMGGMGGGDMGGF